MQAVQVLCKKQAISKILTPLMYIERDAIDWGLISYHALPGGYQTAISWAFVLFCDRMPPADWEYRDPFDSFSVMDRDLQVFVLEAMAVRHGFVKITIEDVPPSPIHKLLLQKEAELNKDLKKKGFKIVDDE